MLNTKYDYSSVHVDVLSPLADEIIAWGKQNVSDDDIYVSQRDPSFGREDEIHVTVLYGIHSESADPVVSAIQSSGRITAKLGKLSVFTNPYRFDVLMIEVISPDLVARNQLLQEKVKFTNKYGAYRPHLTIAYVKKGKGWKHHGVSRFEGKTFSADYAVFSSKKGFKQVISL